ncbi:MFS transporter [Legionella massiliensis]|nr:MFS transporter [Legionella massiliensis]
MPRIVSAWLNWMVSTCFALFQFFLQAAAGLMATGWQNDFQLTSGQVGTLSAAFFISYTLMQVPVGLIFDRFGARKILIIATIIMVAGCFSLALSQVYWQAILARLVMGIGSSFGFVGMLYVTSSWFSGRYFALFIGVSETLAMLGVALGEIGMATIISTYGWRYTMIVVGCVATVMTGAVILIIRDHASLSDKNKKALPIVRALKEVLSNRQVWLAGYYGFALFSIVNVVVTLWGIPFLIERYYPLTLDVAGAMMSMVFLGIAIGGPFNAWLIQRWKHRQLFMQLFALVTTILFALTIYIPKFSPPGLYFIFLSLGIFSSSYIQVFAIVKDTVSTAVQATALSVTNMIVMISAPLLQPLVGLLLEKKYSFTQSLSLISIILIINLITSFALDKK